MPGPLEYRKTDPNHKKGSLKDRGAGWYYRRSGNKYSKYSKTRDKNYTSNKGKGSRRAGNKVGRTAKKGAKPYRYAHAHDFPIGMATRAAKERYPSLNKEYNGKNSEAKIKSLLKAAKKAGNGKR